MLPELTIDEYSATLDDIARDALDHLPHCEPPIDARALAGALGLDVAWDTAQDGRGRTVALRPPRGPASSSILLRPEPRPERTQWAIAHEIGEHLAVHVFAHLGVDPREARSGAREEVANQLAGRLLLPGEWFSHDGRNCDWDLAVLKRRYTSASHELIARRMLDFASGVVITIFDHGRRTFRRGNMQGRLPALDSLELVAWREAHNRGHIAALGDHRLRVRAWPVHEAGWKREILRSEWHGGEAGLDAD